MEREIQMTGIGGQGIQLAARTLAIAAMDEGRDVMLFGSYGGMMRGGNTDATIVVADEQVTAPPTVRRTWAALALHPRYWPPVAQRLRPGGVAVLDAALFGPETTADGCAVVRIDAGPCAASVDAPRAASFVAIGALAAATDVVSLSALLAATESVLPPYRQAHAAANARAVAAGHGLVAEPLAPAWTAEPVPVSRSGR